MKMTFQKVDITFAYNHTKTLKLVKTFYHWAYAIDHPSNQIMLQGLLSAVISPDSPEQAPEHGHVVLVMMMMIMMIHVTGGTQVTEVITSFE